MAEAQGEAIDQETTSDYLSGRCAKGGGI